jgi:hypothetical protein
MTRNPKTLLVAAIAASLGSAIAAEQHEHGHHHHHFAQDIDAFHGVLAPVWHAPQGKVRSQNACAKTGQMVRLANDIRSTDASGLKASLATLKKACQKKGDVDGALFEVHEEFHRLIEAKPGA